MIDERDPHYALGMEHGHGGVPRVEFQDAEHQRRYLLGYDVGRHFAADALAQSIEAYQRLAQQRAFQRVAHQMQTSQMWRVSWGPKPTGKW